MVRFRLVVTVLVALFCGFGVAAAQTGPQAPTVTTYITDTAGVTLSRSSVEVGVPVQLRAELGGAGPAPSGAVTFATYPSGDCSGEPDVGPSSAVSAVGRPEALTADISNASGWDAATTWVSNGADQLASNWYGGLFAGSDNAFFGASSMAWRFTDVPIKPGDIVTDASLSLRIRQSRPSLASEGTWTWQTVLATDTRSGADFEGETRATFLSRFNFRGADWQMALSADGTDPDPFGTNNGATFAASPAITDLVAARIADASWVVGGDLVVGILDNRTIGIAEASVDAQPDVARLHLEWTTTESVETAVSAPFLPKVGIDSYRAQYGGDSYYAPAGGPCTQLTVTTVGVPPSVGGVASAPVASAPPARSDEGGMLTAVKFGFPLAFLVIGCCVVIRARVRRSPPRN